MAGPNLVDDPSGHGSITFALDGGILHKIQIQAGGNNLNVAPGAKFGAEAGTFGFTIAGVSEPTSWALLIPGFGVVGTALRRRRPVAA